MGSYVPSTLQERQEMLESIGLSSIDQLFSHIPDELKLKGELNLPSGMSELEVSSAMKKIAAKNVVFGSIFRGAGAYDQLYPFYCKKCDRQRGIPHRLHSLSGRDQPRRAPVDF